MKAPAPEPGELSAEQEVVVSASADACMIVQAGAGTGKTFTLVERLTRLAEGSDLDADDELLVLSFSRAAVAEVRRRVHARSTQVPCTPVNTFDSYATSLLARFESGDDWSALDYDGRIVRATELLDDRAGELRDELALRHVLIDEAQDLVGCRAQFVTALLRTTRTGFTVFTDAAQAIYGFSLEDSSAEGDDEAVVDLLPLVLADRPLERYSFTEQRRARTNKMQWVMDAGSSLADPGITPERASSLLYEVTEGLPHVAGLDELGRLLRKSGKRTTAILCRSTAHAIQASEHLADMGVEHRLQRSARDRVVGPWLAVLAGESDTVRLTRSRFQQAIENLPVDVPLGPDRLWPVLRRMGPSGNREVDLRLVASRVRDRDIPREVDETASGGVVVSTVHRSKGLEFDQVIVDFPQHRDPDLEESRVLYVALSRAREGIFMLERRSEGMLWKDRRFSRVVASGFPKGRRPVSGFEILSGDVDRSAPPAFDATEESVAGVQEHLATGVRPGDPVTLELVRRRFDIGEVPCYRVVHDGYEVSRTSEYFGDLLERLWRGGRNAGWPERIEGLRVDAVETVAGDASLATTADLSEAGLWLGVRLCGLGRFGPGTEDGE